MEELDETQQNEIVETENNTPKELETENTEMPVKTFTQEEVDAMVQKRLNRQEKNLNRQYQEELDKYKELAYLNQKGLKAENLDDTLKKSREFYGKQGITYTKEPSERDSEILADADSKSILDSVNSTDELQDEVNKMKSRNLNSREKIVLKNLEKGLSSRKRKEELDSIGASKDVIESDEFKSFASLFKDDAPIKNVYDMYIKNNKTVTKKESAGSMKTKVDNTEVKDFYTRDEALKFKAEDYEKNPKLEEAVEKSMLKW